ncbi:hypothetical protein DPX16_2044 [Anabarilius grahami]|uniref:Uncharacterized protein n=1 Tax=Anabarilius grahami TaxID=495550 RepID=A0A3N0Y0U7_ANAGA|nr:hypothetical protein DPX16_2044 [Anabarilius grahami]
MASVSLQWIFRLLVVLIIFQGVCVVFYYTTNTHSSRDAMTDTLQQLRCAKLRQKFSIIKPAKRDAMTDTLQQLRCAKLRQKFSIIKPAKSINFKSFTQELSGFLSCPYKSNQTERELNRQVDPPAPPPVADPITPPWPVDMSAPSWLFPPSAPPDTIVLAAPPGSLIPPDFLPAPRISEHPLRFVSSPLRFSSSSTLVLRHPGSTSVLRHPGSTSDTRHYGSTSRTIGVARSRWLFICV